MRRRAFIGIFGGAIITSPTVFLGAALAQRADKVYRIGILESVGAAANATNVEAFRRRLGELGYVEGRNLIIEYRSADGQDQRFPTLASELIASNVDLLVTRGTPAALAAKSASASLPVVMTSIADPLVVVSSIAHPGGHVTGLTALLNDLTPKRLELLKVTVPGIAAVASLHDLSNPAATTELLAGQESAARSLGLDLQIFDARQPEDFARIFDEIAARRFGALSVSNDTLMQANFGLITELAIKHRLPTIHGWREFVTAGGLISYGTSYAGLYRQAAAYVDKIFKGANPGDLPIKQPTRFELIVNLKTARAIGLEIPASVIARADEVIE